MKQQLGRAFSIIAELEAHDAIMDADLQAFHAPSECWDLVFKDQDKKRRFVWRHARHVSGLNRRQFRQAWQKCNPKWINRATFNIIARSGYHA